ncbi:hypothetical protein JTE90_022725 [Oedothorax gibbosus]|uniref:Uncharacterized protein n=1 Tax=Oedothorax gibbosus TaxID=931172 RepID=A0AAV6UQ11_9ARAC|nr:hypothetical protein JTE90_022725 [Oedothorax gibbosus]
MRGKRKNKNRTKVKIAVENDSVTTEFSASEFSSVDFTSISDFQRKNVNDIKLKDMKCVQFQLEDILVCATKRKKHLEEAISDLENLNAKRNKRSKSTDSLEKKGSEERPPKKIKEAHSKSVSLAPQPKGKFIQTHYVDLDAPKIQKNDAASRFWTFLEPYCAEITQDTIRAIESWMHPQANNEKYQRIPKLGQHFASKWPLEDIIEELKEGSKSVENNKGMFTDSVTELAEVEKIINLGLDECKADPEDQYDSLINRIIYSLVGENLMTFLDDTMTEVCNGDIVINIKPCLSQTYSVFEADTIEKRLTKDLHEIGLLELTESQSNGTNDEVLRELKILQGALQPVNEYNTLQKKKLLVSAKAEMAKQELKKKLQEVDAKVMEIYRIVAAARRNNSMSKKLEEQVKRTLREKKKLVEKLKNMK